MPRMRQLYAGDLLFCGPTGFFPATGFLQAPATWGLLSGSIGSGQNLVAELFRIQKVDDGWNRKLKILNEFGQLAQVDLVPIDPPDATFSISYVLANLVNEDLMGFSVNKAGDTAQVSCVSGIITQSQSPKNYFIKTVSEGNDAINYNPNDYDVVSYGNSFISSYTSQGRVLDFPTVDVAFRAVNAQAQHVWQQNTGGWAITPAVTPANGLPITGWGYILPTGTTSVGGLGIVSNTISGLSVLRPGDILLNFGGAGATADTIGGINAGQGFSLGTDLKIQSYNISVNFNLENLAQLGSKAYYAILPKFPVEATLTVECLAGDFQTGMLTEIVNNNDSFNPTITLNEPGTLIPVVSYQLKNAKFESQEYGLALNNNKTVRYTFRTIIGGPQDTINGMFMSGYCLNGI
jgi:hypothetical protein